LREIKAVTKDLLPRALIVSLLMDPSLSQGNYPWLVHEWLTSKILRDFGFTEGELEFYAMVDPANIRFLSHDALELKVKIAAFHAEMERLEKERLARARKKVKEVKKDGLERLQKSPVPKRIADYYEEIKKKRWPFSAKPKSLTLEQKYVVYTLRRFCRHFFLGGDFYYKNCYDSLSNEEFFKVVDEFLSALPFDR